MADDVDKTNERNDAALAAYIQRVRDRANIGLEPTGECYNCSEPVSIGRSFCSTECREDYDYRERVKRSTGA